MRVLVVILLCLLTGCSSDKQDIQDSTTIVQEEPVVEDVLEMDEPLDIEETYLSGVFVEDTDNYPSTFVFHEDNTFDANLNMCHGMVNAAGTYIKKDSSVTITFDGYAGYTPVDSHSSFTFTIEGNTLIYDKEEVLSCAFVNVYVSKEE